MIIERPPQFFRRLFPGALFRPEKEGDIYITFDDGPIPEMTPLVLDILDDFGIKATFFMVGDNARRYPELVREVIRRGHAAGNHTMHHLQGVKTDSDTYLKDVAEARKYIDSLLFRPPHGLLRGRQLRELKKDYTIVMYDLITRDYSKRLSSHDVVKNVKRYARPGSIIVFHDSLKSQPRLLKALPIALKWLLDQGFTPKLIPYEQK